MLVGWLTGAICGQHRQYLVPGVWDRRCDPHEVTRREIVAGDPALFGSPKLRCSTDPALTSVYWLFGMLFILAASVVFRRV